ncbi:SAM-dependent methyltransferase [Salinibacter altiplanensis]|uniref:SAM-dependent methyltransferase n=1 Tax=Salinibacter altiplanensis TaxID=1803181 RepID=UPI001F26A58F|nr:class I SAM-dependent methyltransferase [Salinibacter altiplanensis]
MPKPAAFWNDRFARDEYVYGEAPNQFVASAAETWLPDAAEVLTLGAGEGRNAVHLARQGHAVTAVDYAAEGLRKTHRLAKKAGVAVETMQADVRSWAPPQTWDAVGTTFLHLPPDERPPLYRLIQDSLRPGGLLIAEWFRPEQRTEGYTSGGPPDVDMMVTDEELRDHFAESGIERLEIAEPMLDEGMHEGPGATVRFVWRRPA